MAKNSIANTEITNEVNNTTASELRINLHEAKMGYMRDIRKCTDLADEIFLGKDYDNESLFTELYVFFRDYFISEKGANYVIDALKYYGIEDILDCYMCGDPLIFKEDIKNGMRFRLFDVSVNETTGKIIVVKKDEAPDELYGMSYWSKRKCGDFCSLTILMRNIYDWYSSTFCEFFTYTHKALLFARILWGLEIFEHYIGWNRRCYLGWNLHDVVARYRKLILDRARLLAKKHGWKEYMPGILDFNIYRELRELEETK